MLRGRTARFLAHCAVAIGWIALHLVAVASAAAQAGLFGAIPPTASPSGPGPVPSAMSPGTPGQIIADVQIVGNRTVSVQEIRAALDTRAGQPLDPLKLQRDVRNLTKTRKIFDVKVKTQPTNQSNAVIVIFEVYEFPKLEYVYFIGNSEISTRSLKKQAALNVNDPMDVVAVEDARRKLMTFYREKGFNKAQIQIREGTKRSDHGAVFVINEGPQQRVWSVEFVGNTIVSGARLKTQIESKPSKIKYLTAMAGGYVDRQKIDEDVNRLTSYYRSLGYMLARVGRSMDYTDDDRWLKLTFVVDEGPRFKVRSVSFVGNRIFGEDRLRPLLKLQADQYFDLATMNKDVLTLTDAYGGVGFILADIKPSPRTLESKPEIDLVYDISEGNRYRVGRINVAIGGDNPHTQRNVALHRIDLRPGDIVDIRKIRASERRLQASGLFLNDPVRGVRPRIVFNPKNDPDSLSGKGRSSGTYRGQSPDTRTTFKAPVVITVIPDENPSASAARGRPQ